MPIFSDTLFTQTARNRFHKYLLCRLDPCQRNFFKSLKESCSVEKKDFPSLVRDQSASTTSRGN